CNYWQKQRVGHFAKRVLPNSSESFQIAFKFIRVASIRENSCHSWRKCCLLLNLAALLRKGIMQNFAGKHKQIEAEWGDDESRIS
ncbi:MAG: hypothetical protein KC423_28440, partial [Anaerolineales bacterium]|nr:hypothetical protein [Anaerolineales bacterium]